MPPTDPGPGIFPATAAACAATAAWAVAACCCICRWHWRKSNTCAHRTQMSGFSFLMYMCFTFRQDKRWQCLCYLYVGTGVNFMYSITRSSSGLTVQIITLNKHSVITETANPNVTLALTLQLNTFTDMKPTGEREVKMLVLIVNSFLREVMKYVPTWLSQ